jgi:hypothetical protein
MIVDVGSGDEGNFVYFGGMQVGTAIIGNSVN